MSEIPELLSLAEATHIIPSRPSIPTLWRWCRRGTVPRGGGPRIRLRHVRLGGRIFIAPEWIREYMQALAQADLSHFGDDYADSPTTTAPRTRTASEREQAIREAEQKIGVRAGCGL